MSKSYEIYTYYIHMPSIHRERKTAKNTKNILNEKCKNLKTKAIHRHSIMMCVLRMHKVFS